MVSTKILVVADSAIMRRILQSQLREIGYSAIDEAQDGAEALAKLKSEHFEFAIIEEQLSDLSGWVLIDQIRSNRLLPYWSILFMLASATKEKTVALDKAGAGGYIVKPFTRATLEEKISKVFQKVASYS